MMYSLSLGRLAASLVVFVICLDIVLSAPYGWTNVKLIKGSKDIKSEKGIGRVLKRLSNQYKVSFEFYAKKSGGKWGNVVQLTPGGKKARVFGNHIATVFYNDGQEELMVMSSDRADRPFTHTVKNLSPNRWHKVELSQELKHGRFYRTLVVDGRTQISQETNDAQTYSSVAVFTGAPWYRSIDGSIQNLNISFKR